MRVVQQLDEDRWREFVDRHPRSNIFHTPEMFRVFARVPGHRPALWAALGDDGRPLALLPPVLVTLMGGPLRRLTTRAVAYGGPLCAPGAEGRAALAQLLAAYNRAARRRVLFTELRNMSDQGELQPVLHADEFTYEEHLNYLIDLEQPEEAIWRKISKSGRQGVRTARNKGASVEELTGRQGIDAAYGLLRGVYARARVPLASLALFEAAFDILGPRGMFKIFATRAGGRCISACLLLLYNGRILYWYAGSDRAFAAYAPTELMIWHVLRWGREQGFRLFDFGGAGKPGEPYGPREFKAKFGGALVSYGRNVRVHTPLLLRLSKAGYRLYRRLLIRRPREEPANAPLHGRA